MSSNNPTTAPTLDEWAAAILNLARLCGTSPEEEYAQMMTVWHAAGLPWPDERRHALMQAIAAKMVTP